MNYDILKIGLILGLPILAPPIIQYRYDVSAPLVLTAIIIAYLPLWYRLRNQNKDTEK
jgi:Ca2+/Na+ antiporter